MSNLESRLEKAKKVLKEIEAEVEERNQKNDRMGFAEAATSKTAHLYPEEKALLKKLKDTRATVGRLKAKIHNKKQEGGRTRRVKGGLKKTRRNTINAKFRSSN
jgi:hypothetical protein